MSVKRALCIFVFGLCWASGSMAKIQPDRPLYGTWDFKPHVAWQADRAGKEVFQYGSLLIDEQGQIWYLDKAEDKVHLFSAQGRWIRSFGRTGDGPGDLCGPHSLFMVGEELAVNENRRVSFFSRQGEYRASERMLVHGLQAFGWVGGQRLACRTSFISGPVDGEETVCIFDFGAKRARKLIDLPAHEYVQRGGSVLEFSNVLPAPVTVCDGKRVICGFSGSYKIHVFGADGREITTVELDRKRPPISLGEREELIKDTYFVKNTGMSAAQVARLLPSEYTHYDRFFADAMSGYILVQRPHAQSARMICLDLFGPQGAYLYKATLRLPVEGETVSHTIAPGRWVVIVEDETGDTHLVFCSLKWPNQGT